MSLPECTSRYVDLPVLILTTSGRAENFKKWFQQGATDAVNLHKSAAAKNAIKRLVDECMLKQKQRNLNKQVQQLEKEVTRLQSMLKLDKKALALTAANDTEHNAADKVLAKLKRIRQPIVENVIANYKPRDITTGLLARISVLERFQKILSSEIKAPRFTALLISIDADNHAANKKTATKNVQDATLHRAVHTLQTQLNTGTILGRINHNALLLIQSSDDEPVSRDAANRVRDTLGSLGGLIDAQTDVHINTMNLPTRTSISANEVVERLEATT